MGATGKKLGKLWKAATDEEKAPFLVRWSVLLPECPRHSDASLHLNIPSISTQRLGSDSIVIAMFAIRSCLPFVCMTSNSLHN